MNIKILTTEKVKEDFIKEGISEYQKRLSRYCKIRHIPIKKLQDIGKHSKDSTYKIIVNYSGEMMSSEKLAEHIKALGIQGKSDIIILITPEEIKDIEVDMHLALTSMDMSKELMVLTLYEQVYRAFTIIHGLPYHK